MLADFIGILLIIALFFAIHFLREKPAYQNHFIGGKPFSEEEMKRLNEARARNNPYDDPVGPENGRCQYCGSAQIDQEFRQATPFMFIENGIKSCHSCGKIIEYH